jgi:hypothetical protein
MDYRKLSREKWIEFATGLKYGDTMFVAANDLVGNAIQWGTENNKGEKIQVAHVMSYEGLGIGQTREADGKKMCAKHLINEYMDRAMKGQTRIITYRAKGGLKGAEETCIKSFWDLHEKEDYNMMENVGYGIWALLNKINRSFGAWVAKTFTNPFYNGKNMVCSQTELLKYKNSESDGGRLYAPIMTDIKMDKLTPIEYIDRIERTHDKIMDTETL